MTLAEVLARLTKAELMGLARAAEIPGRSTMTKDQLVAALLSRVQTERSTDSGPHPPPPPERCPHRSERGHPCGLPLYGDLGFCALHSGLNLPDLALPVAGRLGFDTWPALLRTIAIADYDTDPLGFDPVIADMVWHLGNFIYRDYFRVDVEGAEHIPSSGPGILVANHAGAALPWDATMLGLAVANEPAVPRRVRLVGTEIFNILPWVSHLYRKTGSAYASHEDSEWVLANNHLLGVFPEGVAGFQKSQQDAYQTKRFGRGGFVNLAIRTGSPIVPVAIIGSEETHPVLFTSRRLAQVVKMFFPEQRVEEMAVWLNPIPLPIKWQIAFLEPIDVGAPNPRPDRLTVLELAEEVRGRIQKALDRMLVERDGIF